MSRRLTFLSYLSCVFRRFDLAVPPADSDAARHSELPAMKRTLQARLIAQKASEAVSGKKEAADANRQARELATQTEFWSKEEAEYLGLDRVYRRPDMVLQRLVQKGALKPTKIGRRLVFKKGELDKLLAKGDVARGRGRPRKEGK